MKIIDAATKLNDTEYIKRLESDRAELLDALRDTTASLAMYLFQEGGSDKLRESRTLYKAHAAIIKAEG